MTRITVEDTIEPAVTEAIWGGLKAFNEAATGPGSFDREPMAVVLREGDGTPIGGLMGRSASGWLYIELFHLPEAHRRGGQGRAILAAAEEEARRRGCVGVRLETYSFQAPGFYARMGYVVVGRLPDCPVGHTRFSLAKRLDGVPLEAF